MEKIGYYFRKIVLFLMLIFIGIITYFALFTLNLESSYLKKEIQSPQYILIIGGIIITGFIVVIFSVIDKCEKTKYALLSRIFMLVLIVGQLFLIFLFDITQVTDAFMVKDQALAIVEGIDKHFDYESTWYFARYGNNNFIVVFFVWFYKILKLFHITNDTIPFAILNMICIDVGLFLLFKTLCVLGYEKSAVKFLLLCILNPITYMMVWWIYSATLSIPLGTGVIYVSVLIYRDSSSIKRLIGYSAILGILLSIGYLLRPTALIPFIAVVCCFFVCGKLRSSCKKVILVTICVGIMVIGCNAILQQEIAKYAVEDDDNFPITHWLMMGIHDTGVVNKADNGFTESFDTKEEKTKANLREIKDTLREYGITGFVNHCIKKLPITWSDGTSECFARMRQIGKGNRLYQWISGEKRDIITFYCQSYYIVLLILIFLSVFRQWKRGEYGYLFLFTLTLFGGIAFYLLWESKPSYNLPFVPFVYVLAVDGAKNVFKINIKKKNVVKAGKILMLITVIVGISNYWIFAKNTDSWKNYVIYSSNEVMMKWQENLSEKSQILKQEFFANRKFNTINISAKKLAEGDCQYYVQLWSENEMIVQKLVGINDIQDRKVILNFRTQEINGKQKYIIKIIPKIWGESDTIKWGSHFSKVSDQYEGGCYLDEEELVTDLFIRVYNEKEGVYMSPVLYVALLLSLLLSEWFIICRCYKNFRK